MDHGKPGTTLHGKRSKSCTTLEKMFKIRFWIWVISQYPGEASVGKPKRYTFGSKAFSQERKHSEKPKQLIIFSYLHYTSEVVNPSEFYTNSFMLKKASRTVSSLLGTPSRLFLFSSAACSRVDSYLVYSCTYYAHIWEIY